MQVSEGGAKTQPQPPGRNSKALRPGTVKVSLDPSANDSEFSKALVANAELSQIVAEIIGKAPVHIVFRNARIQFLTLQEAVMLEQGPREVTLQILFVTDNSQDYQGRYHP